MHSQLNYVSAIIVSFNKYRRIEHQNRKHSNVEMLFNSEQWITVYFIPFLSFFVDLKSGGMECDPGQ